MVSRYNLHRVLPVGLSLKLGDPCFKYFTSGTCGCGVNARLVLGGALGGSACTFRFLVHDQALNETIDVKPDSRDQAAALNQIFSTIRRNVNCTAKVLLVLIWITSGLSTADLRWMILRWLAQVWTNGGSV